eukprot:5166704-Pyramimonas_sp.AAC.1
MGNPRLPGRGGAIGPISPINGRLGVDAPPLCMPPPSLLRASARSRGGAPARRARSRFVARRACGPENGSKEA